MKEMKNETDFFIALLRKGEVLKCESNNEGWISRIKLDGREYVLTITEAIDIQDVWNYSVSDLFGKLLSEGQYTRLNPPLSQI